MKNICIFIDGTGATAQTRTNVYKTYEALAPGPMVIKRYFEGIGVKWYSRIPSGVFGLGVTRKILEAYKWLCEVYEEGDQIALFGFSRGAYAARALTELIYYSGIVRNINSTRMRSAWKNYRKKGTYKNYNKSTDALEADIAYLGLWDTVGAIGIPGTRGYAQGFLHDLRLTPNVKSCRHAVAIDEKRTLFEPLLFKKEDE